MTEPSGLEWDFGVGFKSSADRVVGEAVERAQYASRMIQYNMPFLDDVLRGILPHDLILLGALTGAGKTELAKQIAMYNAYKGKRVHYFALEAEPNEIERRIKFALLAEYASRAKRDCTGLNYPDWYLGQCESIVGDFNEKAEDRMGKVLKTLFTYYRGKEFGHDDIKRLLLGIQSETDLIVLDHLHYVDIDDEDENRGFKQTVKMIRDVTLGMGKPMILVAHIRKAGTSTKPRIIPSIDDFHGTSDISKIVTRAIMLAPASRVLPIGGHRYANTFICAPKDRMGGASPLIAVCRFDKATSTYDEGYTLGRATPDGSGFEELEPDDVPRWAKHHQRLPT